MFKNLLIGGVVICGSLVMIGLMVIGVMSPATEVLPWEKIPKRHQAKVLAIAELEPNEKPLMFYSAAFLSFRGDGNLVTDRAIYSWSDETGTFVMDRVPYKKITSIDAYYSDGWVEDSQILIWYDDGGEDDEVVAMIASNEKHGDHRMVGIIERYSGRTANAGKLDRGDDDAGPAHPAARAASAAAGTPD